MAKAYTPMKLELPTEKSVPVSEMTAFSYFFYGKQGIGKTSFTAQFPDAIHMMFEPGAKTESIFAVYPQTWAEVLEYTRMIRESDKYKNVIIDTIDLMFDMCCKQVCKDAGVTMLKDIGFGDGYNQSGNRFRDVLTDLHSNKGLVMLAHDKIQTNFDDPNAAPYTVPSTAKRGAETVAKWVDLTAHYYLDKKGLHKLRIRSSVDREAKNRIKKRFMYTDGTEIVDIDMGNNEFEAYHNFENAFNNKVDKLPQEATSVASLLQKNKTKQKLTLKNHN
jgi:hypothetical protein